jgi:hypothetical protein
MKKLFFVCLSALVLYSCQQKACKECASCGEDLNIQETTLESAVATSTVETPKVDTNELQENLLKIEAKYGEQWDFCNCVVVGDSINDALQKDMSDKELDKLLKRFDYVDKKCQAFRIQDPNRTPEERDAHEKRVRKCLKNAGRKK